VIEPQYWSSVSRSPTRGWPCAPRQTNARRTADATGRSAARNPAPRIPRSTSPASRCADRAESIGRTASRDRAPGPRGNRPAGQDRELDVVRCRDGEGRSAPAGSNVARLLDEPGRSRRAPVEPARSAPALGGGQHPPAVRSRSGSPTACAVAPARRSCRLREDEARAGARDVALGEQRVERDEQVRSTVRRMSMGVPGRARRAAAAG